jgi:hypothetical protein
MALNGNLREGGIEGLPRVVHARAREAFLKSGSSASDQIPEF